MRRLLIGLTTVISTFAMSSAVAAGLTLTATGNSVPVSATVNTSYCAAAFNLNYDTSGGYVSGVTVSSTSADCNGDLYSIAFSGKSSPSLDPTSDALTGVLSAVSPKAAVANGFKIVFAIPLQPSAIGSVTVTVAP